MVDRFSDPLFTPSEVSQYLRIPQNTVYKWLGEGDTDQALVHRVAGQPRGHASVPFIALVEAYVLRALRDLHLKKSQIRAAAEDVRREFDTPYALASKRIATDGIDIFIDHAEDGLARAGDQQRPMREVIHDHLRYISWDESEDGFATQLRLRQFPDIAPVIIDPRFGWGAPVVERTKVPVRAVIDLWSAGESMDTVADEYGLTHVEVEAICQAALRAS
jgi:uncharacterized protein (DUF433 family)